MSKRGHIRIYSFFLAALAVVSATAIYQYNEAKIYRRYVNLSNQRAVYDLIDDVRAIDMSLEKSIHASTPEQSIMLSSKVYEKATSASSSLSQLPLSSDQITTISKFLSQAGDYSYYLMKQAALDQKMDDETQKQLEELSTYARTLSDNLTTLGDDISAGNVDINIIKTKFDQNTAPAPESLDSGIKSMEETMHDYPSMIYDGPFSDSIDQVKSKFLADKPDVTQEEALKKSADFIGVSQSILKYSGDAAGKIPAYFYDAPSDVSIITTKAGGYVLNMINSRKIGQESIDIPTAINNAKAFLTDKGFPNMVESYYLKQNGILTINFAFKDGDYICYSDLIKVGIALDNGDCVSFDSKGYLMNHIDKRDILPLKFTREQIEPNINSRLTPIDYNLAVIPTDSNGEKFVHEFLCKNTDDRKYIVYFDTQTGVEVNMFILLESDNGVVTM